MASSTTCSSIFLFLLFSSFHVHARDSQFFSKVTNNNIPKEVLPTKEQEPLNKPEQEPNFVPQNSGGGYGLFDHKSVQLPPTTTTTENRPYKTETKNPYSKENYPNLDNGQYYNTDAYVNQESYSNLNKGDQYYTNDANYVTKLPQGMSDTRFMDKAYTTPNGDQYYNNDANYVTKPQGMSNTRFMDKAYTTPITDTNNNFYNGDNVYNNNREHGIGEQKLGVTNGNNEGNMYNNGMSDTRVMENGRYFYDRNSKKNYNLNNNNNNANENSRRFHSRNEYYNNRGTYGNNENSYEAKNFMEGYKWNQEEFQEIQDEQFMP